MPSKPLIILENIRSAYNVGNIIRTADALWYDVILSGFTPHPDEKEQIKKTSLGAEESVHIQQFWNTTTCLQRINEEWYDLIVGEECVWSVAIDSLHISNYSWSPIALLVGNENDWVMNQTLDIAKHIVHIPMQGIKESLNVGQAAAILMWELRMQINH